MAGLGDLFRDAAVLGRQIAGDDIFKPSLYQVAPEQIDYDPSSGRPVWHVMFDAVAVPMMVADYSRRERLDTSIRDTDARGVIAGLDIAAITPKVGDIIKDGDGRVWEVVNALGDPVAALHDLQLRPYPAGWPQDW